MRVFGMKGDNLTQEIKRYLEMIRQDFEYVELTEHPETLKELKLAEGGDLKLVWLELNGERRLVESLSVLCRLLQCEGLIKTNLE